MNDTDEIIEMFKTMLGKAAGKCPNAEIIISSILPFSGDEYEKANIDILQINQQLRDFVGERQFVDNYPVVMDEMMQIDTHMYKDERHIKPSKKGKLAGNILNKIKEVYFSGKLATGDGAESPLISN